MPDFILLGKSWTYAENQEKSNFLGWTWGWLMTLEIGQMMFNKVLILGHGKLNFDLLIERFHYRPPGLLCILVVIRHIALPIFM